jgi:ribosomal protein S18 acetylase RimI-like enzyme
MVDVRPIIEDDADIVRAMLTDAWGSAKVAGHGVLYDASALPGLIGYLAGQPAGLLTYHVDGDSWEIVTLSASVRERGIGTALVRAVEQMVRRDGARRLWLITTNHNTVALRFYQRLGFDLVALHRDGVTRARAELKPEIPLEVDGIPLRHELELEMRLD